MNLKRVFAVFCALAAAVAFLPVHGAERITDVRYTVNDGFEDYTGGAPAGWTAYGVWDSAAGGAYTPVPASCPGKNGGTGVEVTLTSGQYTAGIEKDLGGALTPEEYLEFTFDVKAESDTAYPVIRLAQADNVELARIAFVNGAIKASDKATNEDRPVIGTYDYTPGEWFNVRLRVDGHNGTYSVWVDGTEAVRQRVYAWDGGLMNTGYDTLLNDTKKQTWLNTTAKVMLGVYEAGVCAFDNVTAVKYIRETNAGTAVFSTDFSDLGEGLGRVPRGFMLPSRYWGVGGAELDAEHGTSLALKADDKAGLVYKLNAAATGGTVTYEFDVYKEGTAWNTPLSIVGYGTDVTNSVLNEWESIWLLKDTQDRLGSGDTRLNDWMHYQMIINLNTKEILAYCDGKEIGRGGGTAGTWDKTKIGALRLSAYDMTADPPAEAGSTVYIDNFQCVVSPSADAISVADEFDYTDQAGLEANWKATYTGTPAITFESDGENSWLKSDNTGYSGAKTVLEKTMPAAIQEGIIHMEYGVKITGSASVASVVADNGSGKEEWMNLPITVFDTDTDGNCRLGMADYWADAHTVCAIKQDTWYDVSSDINLINGDVTVKAAERGTGVVKEMTISMDTIAAANASYYVKNLKWFKFQQTKATQTGAFYLDYFRAEQRVPDVKEPVVEFYGCDGAAYAAAEGMTPAISGIALDFGTAMDTKSILDAVSLVDGAGNQVQYIPLIEGMDVTLLLSGLLEANQSYTLTVGENVKNTSGTALGTACVTEFSTGAGAVYAENLTMKINDAEVTSLSQLGSDAYAAVSGSYVNTLGQERDMRLIISYYKDNRLISTDYQPVNFGRDINFASFSYLQKVKAAGEADMVKVFLWNGERYMCPLAENIALK